MFDYFSRCLCWIQLVPRMNFGPRESPTCTTMRWPGVDTCLQHPCTQVRTTKPKPDARGSADLTSSDLQYWSLLNWQNLRFWCGSVAVLVNWSFVVISPCFAIFKNAVHSLVVHRVTRRLTGLQTMHNVIKNSKTFKNGCGAVAVRLRSIFQFTYVQYCILVTWIKASAKFKVHSLAIKKLTWAQVCLQFWARLFV